jgi:chemotaxis protein methyltransferase CheR
VRQALQGESGWDVHILASDIDTDVLARAQAGIYPLESLSGLPAPVVRAWFLKGYGAFSGMAHVRPELQPMIEFRRINLNNRAWEVHAAFDVVFCRNVIIYFDRVLQQRIVRQLTTHLTSGGYFFCGHSENLTGLADTLHMLQPTIYQLTPKGPSA